MNVSIPGTRSKLSILTLAAVVACVSPSTLPSPEIPSPQPSGNEPAQPITRETKVSKSWQLSPTTDAERYTTVITTTIQQSAASSVVADSVITRAQYSLSTARSSSGVLLNGSIQTFTVQAGARIGTDDPIISLPVSFNGHVQDHQLQLDITSSGRSAANSSLPCATPARSALTAIQRNLFVTPLELRTGLTWQDSLSTTSCTGGLALNLIILRTYKVIDEISFNGISVIAMDVNEKTLSTGEGSQDQHRIIVNGQAIKSGRLYIDATTGSLVNLSSETRTTLEIQSSGKTQQFLQSSKETTTRM